MGKHKSKRTNGYCREGIAKRCRGVTNVATMRDGMCRPCWQSKNAKSLNKRRWQMSSRLKKQLMLLPVGEWNDFLLKRTRGSHNGM